MNTYADIVLVAKNMFKATSRNEQPAPGSIAIKGDTIIYVGEPSDELDAYVGPDTVVKHFGENELLMPALCDAHLHLENTILCECGPALRFVQSEEECVANAKMWHEQNPDSYWVIGFGWHQANWPGCNVPNKTLLTEALPDNPAFLMDIDTHCAWVNQKALDELNITADTPDPEGGKIWRDESGEPTGYLEEQAALGIEPVVLKRAISNDEIRKEKLAETISLLNRRGVTEVWDAFDTPQSWLDALDSLDADGKLNMRVNTCVLINEGDDFVERGQKQLERYSNPKALVNFWGFKVIGDGVGGAHTAWMVEPYADQPDVHGACLLDPEDMKRRILECEKAGLPVHVHACGTATVRHALDCFEEAQKQGLCDKSRRNVITHCDTVCESDFPRFKELGIVAALQPDMLAPTQTYETDFYRLFFGDEVYKLAWANRTMFDNCDYISFSSDSPVGFAGTLHQLFRSTQRVFNDGKPEGGIHPEQKISTSEALWAYTWGGAYQLGKEAFKGSLEAGKLADVVVFDHNLFACDPSEIIGTESLLTILNGRVVYENDK